MHQNYLRDIHPNFWVPLFYADVCVGMVDPSDCGPPWSLPLAIKFGEPRSRDWGGP